MAKKIKRGAIYVCLILLALICLLPFLLMIVNATRSGVEITHSFTLIPSNHLGENWTALFAYVNLFRGFGNSLMVAIPATILTAYFSAITAYALAVYRFKGNGWLFKILVVFMMIPAQLSLIGFYNLCQKLHMVDSYLPLIIPAIASPGTVFFLRQYVQSTLSKALLEAARIDGAGELRTFWDIVLPIVKPGVGALAIFTFVNTWNDYFMQLIMLKSSDAITVSLGIARLQSEFATNYGLMMAGATLGAVPIVAVFICFQKYFTQGITMGAVKG